MSGDDRSLLERAYHCLREHRNGEALALLQTVVKQSPDSFEGHYLLGACLAQLNVIEPALVATARAVSLRPDDARAYHNYGALLDRNGRAAEARSAYERALALDPDYAAARHALAALSVESAPVLQVASERRAASTYLNATWGLSLAFPGGWEILWEDVPAGFWTTLLAAQGPETPGGRPALMINGRAGDLLRSDEQETPFPVAPDGGKRPLPRTAGDYLETAKKALPDAFSGFRLVTGEVLSHAGRAGSRLVYSYDRGGSRFREECLTLFAPENTLEFLFEAPEGLYTTVAPVFERMVESLRTTAGEGSAAARPERPADSPPAAASSEG